MKVFKRMISLICAIIFVFLVSSCMNDRTVGNGTSDAADAEASMNDRTVGNGTSDAADTEAKDLEYDAEYESVIFKTVDDFRRAVAEYDTNEKLKDDMTYSVNNFGELDAVYLPEMTDNNFKLFQIVVNKYNVFYYYIPLDESSFDYGSGILVTFPREENATIAAVRKQLNGKSEQDGSFFDTEHSAWFIPLGEKYYSITYPGSFSDYPKDIIRITENK